MGDHCWLVNIGVTMKILVLICAILSLGFVAAQEGDVSKEFLNEWITKIHERYNPDLVKESKTRQGKSLIPKATTVAPTVTPAPIVKSAPYKPIVKPVRTYPNPTYKPVVFRAPSYPKQAPKPAPYTPPVYPKPSPKPIPYAPTTYHRPTYKPTAYKPLPRSYPKPSYSKPKVVFEKPSSYKPAPSSYKPVYTPSKKPAVYAQDYAYDGKANYKYEYAVVDEYSGLNFGANEGRDGYLTQGEYRVLLPDCRTQVVRYNTADAYSGNVAEVTYEGTPCYNNYKKHL